MEGFDSIISKYCVASPGDDTKDKLLGASFAAVTRDGILHTSSAGLVSPKTSDAWTASTQTWVASLTKLVTATAVLHLVSSTAALSLDDDLRSILPQLRRLQILRGWEGDVPILEDNPKPITLRHLLTHTVGLGYVIGDPDLIKWSQVNNRPVVNFEWSIEGISTPLKFAPGDGWYYGTAVKWAGLAIEKISGQTIGAYMSEHIFKPLGMTSTTFRPSSPGGEATWTNRDGSGSLSVTAPLTPVEHPIESGGSGLYTSARDYTAFLQGLISGKIISKDLLAELTKPRLNDVQRGMLQMMADAVHGSAFEFPKGTKLDWGLGGMINMEDVEGKRRAGSVMWSGNANSRWWYDPTTGVAGVLVVNVLPYGDPVVEKLWDELERKVYATLGK